MPIRIKGNISYFTFPELDAHQIVHGVFTRHGGASPHLWKSLNMATSVGDSRENVIENRVRVMNALGLTHESIYDVWQVHGNEVIATDEPRAVDVAHEKADAIVTKNRSVTLLMLFADCVPILLYDPIKEVIGIAHAGWKGTVSDVVGETIRKMRAAFKSAPEDIHACIGPAICQQHYPIGEEVANQFRERFGDGGMLQTDGLVISVDLRKANLENLLNAGVQKIADAGICTYCSNDDWFSHRGEKGRTGRFGAVISLKKNVKKSG